MREGGRRQRRHHQHQHQHHHRHHRAGEEDYFAPPRGFAVVYRPSWCKLRFLLFLTAMWLLSLFLGLALIVSPILIGRYVLSTFFLAAGEKAPELQTFEVGFLLLGIAMRAMHAMGVLARQKGLLSVLALALHFPLVLGKATVMLLVMLGVWPTVVGFYLMLTLSPLLSSLNETAVIPVFTCWFLGFVYGRFFYSMRQHICSEQRNRIMDRLATWEGWYNPRFKEVCFGLLLPYSLRLCVMILGPPLAVLLLCPLVDLSFVQILMLQRWSYCLSLAVPALIFVIWLLMKLRVRLMARIRDETYLVGRRLHNLERRPNAEEVVSEA